MLHEVWVEGKARVNGLLGSPGVLSTSYALHSLIVDRAPEVLGHP